MNARGEHVAAIFLFTIGAVCLFLTAPHHGEFWWSDSPRHALNGVFVKDLVATLPRDPKQWAMQYYIQYPALTILFYPPLFYLISAPFYAVLGVSQTSGLIVVLLHYFMLSLGLYTLARRWTGPIVAIAIGLSAMAIPGMALWGRQIMLEIPSLAFAIWSMAALQSYGEKKNPTLLYVSAFLLVCATYTKLNCIFLFAPMVLTILYSQGVYAFRNKHVWIAALLSIAALIPLAILTLKFGGANIQSVTGIPDSRASRTTLEGWIWYAKHLTALTWWPILVLAVLTPILSLVGIIKTRLSKTDAVLLASWFAIGYLALSFIELKESRHALLILPPILISAGLFFPGLLPKKGIGTALFALIVIATGAFTWQYRPNPLISGYREAAVWIANNAPKNAIIVFSGKRDGSFIFNMRSMENRRDITTIRSDKLLLSIAVRRELGVRQKDLSEQEIANLLDNAGVSYVVAQNDFWTDLAVMKRFQDVLQSRYFRAVAQIPVRSTIPAPDRLLIIYRNMGKINEHPSPLQLDLPIIGRKVKGKLGS